MNAAIERHCGCIIYGQPYATLNVQRAFVTKSPGAKMGRCRLGESWQVDRVRRLASRATQPSLMGYSGIDHTGTEVEANLGKAMLE
jgi:hypothetical protein